MKKYLEPRLFLPIFLIIASFFVYWITKSPSVLWIDSGTMIAASYTLGIPNPPGFPFYMIASHIFSILPIFNVLTRLELFSIVFSVAALYLVYKIILLLIETDFFFYRSSRAYSNLISQKSDSKYIASFIGALALAFSYQYWSQSQNTEAFVFTDFFLILFIYIFMLIEKKRKELIYTENSKAEIGKFADYFFKTLAVLAFLYGLAMGANPTVAALVPGVLLVVFLNRRILNFQRVIVLFLIGIITVSLVYSYLPIRASAWPFVNWGNPQTWSLFIGQLRGAGLNIYEPQSGSINGFTGSPIVFIQSVSHFVYLLLVQFTPFLLPFLFLGGFFVFKKNKKLFLFLMSVPLVDVIYSGIYFSGNQESWFILAWIIGAIFIGIGFYFALLRFNFNKNVKKALYFVWIIPLVFWFVPLNRSGHYYSADYASNLYSSLKQNAILIGTGDFSNSLGFYLHEADKLRPDVTPVTANVLYVNKWYRDDLRHASSINVSPKLEDIIQYKAFDEYNRAMNEFIANNINKHPIYVTHLTLRASALAATDGGQLALDSRFKFIPHGLSLEVVKAGEKVSPDPKAYQYVFRNQDFPKSPFYLERNYITGFKNLKNDYAYGWEALGDWFMSANQYEDALYYYQAADKISPNNAEIIARFGQYYGIKKQYDVSRQFLNQALNLQPNNFGIRFNLAYTLGVLGRIEEARQHYQIIQQYAAGQPIANEAKQNEALLLSAQSSQSGSFNTK